MTMSAQLLTLSAAVFQGCQTTKLLSTTKPPKRNVRSSGTSRLTGPLRASEAQPRAEAVPSRTEAEGERERRAERPEGQDGQDPDLEVVLGLDRPEKTRI